MKKKNTLILLVLLFSLFLCSCKQGSAPETTDSILEIEYTEATETTVVTPPTNQSAETTIPTVPVFTTSEPKDVETTPSTPSSNIASTETNDGLPDNMTEKG